MRNQVLRRYQLCDFYSDFYLTLSALAVLGRQLNHLGIYYQKWIISPPQTIREFGKASIDTFQFKNVSLDLR